MPPEQYCGINIPADKTIAKYGLNRNDWFDLVDLDIEGEAWLCPVCSKTPPSGKTHIDHYHVRNWKQMVPEDRRRYVRGVVCAGCNYFVLSRHLTLEKAWGAARYLARFKEKLSA